MHEEMRKIHTRKCAYIRVNALYVNKYLDLEGTERIANAMSNYDG